MRLTSLGQNATQPQSDIPTPPLSIGSRLRQTREAKNLSLEQVTAATKITIAILKAIENGDTEAMPSAVASRGFIKIYADHLGLDSSDILSQWTKSEPQKKQPSAPSVTSRKLMQSEAYAERPILLSGKQILPAIFIVLLIFICFIVYRAYFSEPDVEETQGTATQSTQTTANRSLQVLTPNNPTPAPQPRQPEKTWSRGIATDKPQPELSSITPGDSAKEANPPATTQGTAQNSAKPLL